MKKKLNKTISIEKYSMLEMVEVVHKLRQYRERNQLDAVSLEPHPNVERYTRENISDINLMELTRTGHAIMVLRYCDAKSLPVFCLGLETIQDDISKITKEMDTQNYKYLASIISKKNEKSILKNFFDNGFINLQK
ncbi:MAG: hypothetical protein ABIG37_02320 [Nanoarchaeota archaeon]